MIDIAYDKILRGFLFPQSDGPHPVSFVNSPTGARPYLDTTVNQLSVEHECVERIGIRESKSQSQNFRASTTSINCHEQET